MHSAVPVLDVILVDRGRKALKISALTDQDGIVHNLRCDPANTSDFRLFTPMLSSMLIDLRRIEVFADRGYDSRRTRDDASQRAFLPRIMRRRCRNSRKLKDKRVRIEHTFGWIDKYRRPPLSSPPLPLQDRCKTLFARL